MTEPTGVDPVALTLAVAAFLEQCRSANTRAAYRTDLRHFAAWCAEDEPLNLLSVDASDLARYRTACESNGASASTVARRMSAVMSFSAYAAEQGLEPTLAAASEVERPTLEASSTAEVLDDADAEALLEAADRTSRRAAVLIRLLMLDGLKVGEASRADASDLRGRPPCVTLTVAGRRSPTLRLHPETGAAIRRYLGSRREGPLLLSRRRGQAPGRLSRFGIDYLVKQTAKEAGLGRGISGNTLRRRCVVAAHADGTDLDAIRENVGHATRRSTLRYLPRRAEAVTSIRKGAAPDASS